MTASNDMRNIDVLAYAEPTQYNLCMTLVLADICEDGVILSSDRKAQPTRIKDGDEEARTSMIKSFDIFDKFVYGISGSGILPCESIDRYIKAHIEPSKSPEVTLKRIERLVREFHEIHEFKEYTIGILIIGLQNNSPTILRLGYSTESNDEFYSPQKNMGKSGDIGVSITDSELNRNIDKVSYKKMLLKHKEIFSNVQKRNMNGVGELADSWLINRDGILKLV